jgi:hypothetical protein
MPTEDDAMDEQAGREELLAKLMELGGRVVEAPDGRTQIVLVDVHPTDRLMALLDAERFAMPHEPVVLIAGDGVDSLRDHPIVELVPGYGNGALDRAFEEMRRDILVVGGSRLASEMVCKAMLKESPEREKDFYRDFERRRPDGSFQRGKRKRR